MADIEDLPLLNCAATKFVLHHVREKHVGVNIESMDDFLDGISLNGHKVDEEYLSNADNWIPHRIFQELASRVKELEGSRNPRIFYEIGKDIGFKRYE